MGFAYRHTHAGTDTKYHGHVLHTLEDCVKPSTVVLTRMYCGAFPGTDAEMLWYQDQPLRNSTAGLCTPCAVGTYQVNSAICLCACYGMSGAHIRRAQPLAQQTYCHACASGYQTPGPGTYSLPPYKIPRTDLACTAKSNARNHLLSTVCTRHAVACG